MKKNDLLITPFFLIGLFLLILNDFYLKREFGNFLTGKISDFAGLLIFPMFIATLVPRLKKTAALIVGICFIIWKLPIITPAIDLINSIFSFTITRVVDYSDYIAISILPFSHFLINSDKLRIKINLNRFQYIARLTVGLISVFAFCSTSIPRAEMPKGSVYIGESYHIKMPKDSIINSLDRLGYKCDYYNDSAKTHWNKGYYQINNIVQTYNDSIIQDTILNVKFDLFELKPNKTRITLINVTLSQEGNIQNWRYLKALSKQYDIWLKNNLIEKIDK
jgi:hypothetical protein